MSDGPNLYFIRQVLPQSEVDEYLFLVTLSKSPMSVKNYERLKAISDKIDRLWKLRSEGK